MSVSEPWRGLHDLDWGQEMKGASLGEGRTTWAGVGEDCRQGRRDCDKKKRPVMMVGMVITKMQTNSTVMRVA